MATVSGPSNLGCRLCYGDPASGALASLRSFGPLCWVTITQPPSSVLGITGAGIPPLLWAQKHLVHLKTDLIYVSICTGSSSWKSWLQPSVLDTFYDILKLSLVLTHPVGWALLLLGKKFNISAQFDYIEWVFWSLLFLQNLRFDGFSVFLKNSFLFQMRINDQI